jgi:hypothetical protein
MMIGFLAVGMLMPALFNQFFGSNTSPRKALTEIHEQKESKVQVHP